MPCGGLVQNALFAWTSKVYKRLSISPFLTIMNSYFDGVFGVRHS